MEKIKNCQNKRKGITLLALVLTIIVLLILAGITINLTIGQDGILKRAQDAGIEHEKAQIKEELELAIFDIRTEKLAKGQSMTREDLVGLEKIGAVMESTGTLAEGVYKDYFFEVDENYEVIIIGKLKGEKPRVQAQVITPGVVAQGEKVEIKVTASISEGNITEIVATSGAVLKTDVSATEKVFEVSANGTYTFSAKADNRRSANTSVEVNTIIEKPAIEIKNRTKTSFTIAVTNNYAEGLITEYKYYVGGVLKSPINTTAKEFEVTGLTVETAYKNIYVEAYIGEQILTSEVTSTTTKPEGLEYNWEELEKVAEAISNNDDIITRDTANVSLQIDGKTYDLAVGDITKVMYDGTEKTVRIIGFNHDALSDTAAYGEGKTNTYAGISFEFVNILRTEKLNDTVDNTNGWGESTLRSTLNGENELNKLGNKKQIKQVNKTYLLGNKSTTTQISEDKLWLLSCSEIWDNGYVISIYISSCYGYARVKEGEQYKYYKDIDATWNSSNTSLVKESNTWWLRSPFYNDNESFCSVNTTGQSYTSWLKNSIGVAPGFAI